MAQQRKKARGEPESRMSVPIDRELHEAIKRAAEREDLSAAQLVRKVMRQYLHGNGERQDRLL